MRERENAIVFDVAVSACQCQFREATATNLLDESCDIACHLFRAALVKTALKPVAHLNADSASGL